MTAAAPPFAVIVNATSGTGHTQQWADELVSLFRRRGAQAQVTLARDGEGVVAAARGALQAGAEVIVAGGGDGTVSAVAAVVAGTEAALGVLPMGTLNHFARDLRIPPALEEAVSTVVDGNIRAVDVGEVNGRLFLNNASLGLYPDIVRDRERQRRRLGRGKWAAMLWATLGVLRRHPFLRVQLEIDGRACERRAPFVFIGNNAYQLEGFEIGERARLDDGQLWLYTTQRGGRLGLLLLALRALCGRLRQAADFEAQQAREIVVASAHRQLHVATDGEVTRMDTPLTFRTRPRALRVLAPAAP